MLPPQSQPQKQNGAQGSPGIETVLKNSLSPQLMNAVMQVPGVNKILSEQGQVVSQSM